MSEADPETIVHGDDLVRPIPEDRRAKQGWKPKVVLYDGTVIDDGIAYMEVAHPRFGVWRYGLFNNAWDQWLFDETVGGAITIPFIWFPQPRLLYIGGVWEPRPNMGDGEYLCAIGGFGEPGEDLFVGAGREMEEEAGVKVGDRLLDPGALNENWNRAFLNTRRSPGVRVAAVRIHVHEVVRGRGDSYTINPAYLMPDEKSRVGKSVCKAEFYPWNTLSRITHDPFLRSGALDVLAAHCNLGA